MAKSTYDGREMQLTDQQLLEAIQGVTLNSDEWGRLCLLAAALAGVPTERGRVLAGWIREAKTGEDITTTIATEGHPRPMTRDEALADVRERRRGMLAEVDADGSTCAYCTDDASGRDVDGEPTCGNTATCTAKE